MRLLKEEASIIKKTILKYIKDAKIILFGSRVDDNKRGGDIDIFVQTNQEVTLKEQIKILTDIEMNGVLRKVDLVLKTPTSKEQPIFKTAIQEGVLL
jgi:predicted nucleotidyltransferase